jgi:hypothetical protein
MSATTDEAPVGVDQAQDLHAQAKKVLISVESPISAPNWFRFQQHKQYAALCNKHAASLGYATFTPHLCNTQVVFYGVQAYIGDFVANTLLATNLFSNAKTYSIGAKRRLK